MPFPESPGASPPRGRLFSLLLVLFAVLILVRAVPLGRAYVEKLLSLHSARALAAGAAAAGTLFLALAAGLLRRPRLAARALFAAALLLVVLSGNAMAAASASAILAATFVAGDAVSRLLRGREAGVGDLSLVFAAGVVTFGLAPLALGEIGLWRRGPLLLLLALLLVLRRRRLPPLARLARESVRLPRGDNPPALEAAWLAAAVLFLAAAWVGTLSPDFTWDALAYHLPEARDVAEGGSVEPILGLAPHCLFWHNEECFLSLGFLFGGEATARFLHFFVGLGAFGAALALARRLGKTGSGPLIVLALAAFPMAILQLRGSYVDWPAAFLVTAAAAEIAASRDDRRRLLFAGFLFGGAVVTKVFALLAGPALLILFLRRGGRRAGGLLPVAAGFFLAVAPWLAWSQSRAGFFLAPFASFESLPGALSDQFPSGRARGAGGRDTSTIGFLRLPYDLTFHSSRFEKNGDGYNGMLPLLLVPGVAAAGLPAFGLFLASAIPVLVPWFRLAEPSVRFLIPLYPMFALFAAAGLTRGTGRFAGRPGGMAGIALAATTLAFPVQFGSTGVEWRVAAGRLSREAALNERIPSLRFWKRVRPEDRVLFVGENDRFHCPARWVFRSAFPPILAWGSDPQRWRRGIKGMRINWIVAVPPPPPDFLDSLPEDVALVERNGPALLYGVRAAPGTDPR